MSGPSVTPIATINGDIVGDLFIDTAGDIYGESNVYSGVGSAVFKVDGATHAVSTSAAFDYDTDGNSFLGGLTADSTGKLYGTTQYGGSTGQTGTVFQIDPATLAITPLAAPTGDTKASSAPTEDAAGDVFYAQYGGQFNMVPIAPTIEELPVGTSTLKTFTPADVHSGLLLDATGDMFGSLGVGAQGRGGVFEIAAGTTTVTHLVDFDGGNGNGMVGHVVMDGAGDLYGNAGTLLFEISGGTYSVRALFGDSGTTETNQIAVDAAGNVFGTTTTGAVYELAVGSSTVTPLISAPTTINAPKLGGLVTGEDGHIYGATNNGVIEEVAACFCPGTLIATEHGEQPVETLQIGDRVTALDGRQQPILWIGRRSYAGAFIAGQHLMLPICVRAGALEPGVPVRNLHVSPGHALFVEGRLIPAWRLVNGVSVIQAAAVDEVSYFHIELEQHGIIWADGAPVESFLDDGCRGQFANVAGYHAQYLGRAPGLAYAARLEEGFALQRIQARIAARAGITPVRPGLGVLRGQIDILEPGRICGWAQDSRSPESPVGLTVADAHGVTLNVLANRYRADLRRAGLGSGCHAFEVALPTAMNGRVTIRRTDDGAVLASSARRAA